MGKKGSSHTTVESYKPTEEEIRMQKQAADYADAVAPNALKLNQIAGNLLYGSYGTVQADYDKMNQAAQSQLNNANQIVSDLTQGKLPTAYQTAMENSIKSGVQNSLGSALNNLAGSGVLNSSVTNKALQGISDSAAEAMAQQYQNNISNLSQLAGQQTSSAGQNISVSAAAQEAAQNPALNLWNASLGLNSGGTGTALAAVAGQGTTTSKGTSSGGSGLFGSALGSLGVGYGNSLGQLWCFTAETKVETPDGEKSIYLLRPNDKVICPNEDGTETEETVTAIMDPHFTDVYTVLTDKKNAVHTTLTQPLMADDGTFILVSNLSIGTALRGVGKVIGVVHSGERKVYDIKVTGENNYYADGFIAKGGTNEW